MNYKHELKVITEFRKIVSEPELMRKKYTRIANLSFAVAWLCTFAVFFGYFEKFQSAIYFGSFAFFGGVALCIGFWLKQIAVQAHMVSPHISVESIDKRLNKIV